MKIERVQLASNRDSRAYPGACLGSLPICRRPAGIRKCVISYPRNSTFFLKFNTPSCHLRQPLVLFCWWAACQMSEEECSQRESWHITVMLPEMLGIKPRALLVLSQSSSAKLQPQLIIVFHLMHVFFK